MHLIIAGGPRLAIASAAAATILERLLGGLSALIVAGRKCTVARPVMLVKIGRQRGRTIVDRRVMVAALGVVIDRGGLLEVGRLVGPT